MTYTFLRALCIFSIVLTSCKNDKAATTANPQQTAKTTQVVEPSAPDISYTTLPILPTVERNVLFQKANEIDYVFYNLPFSMSQNEVAAVRNNISHIDITPFKGIPSNCAGKAMCREFFKSQGEQILEADIYFSPDCIFYVFMGADGQPEYGANMTVAGQNFYNNIIQQASNATPQ